jgi:hypothetical protein
VPSPRRISLTSPPRTLRDVEPEWAFDKTEAADSDKTSRIFPVALHAARNTRRDLRTHTHVVAFCGRLDRAKESLMKEKAPGAWLSLNTSYYVAPIGNPLALLDDSYMLLERAHGIVQLMREALQLSPCVDARSLTLALKAVETLMEMSAGSAEEAHVRFEQIGDGWISGS